jgi:hypothetical protein
MVGLSLDSTTMLYQPLDQVKPPMLLMCQPWVARGSHPFFTRTATLRGAPAGTAHRWEEMTCAIRPSAYARELLESTVSAVSISRSMSISSCAVT